MPLWVVHASLLDRFPQNQPARLQELLQDTIRDFPHNHLLQNPPSVSSVQAAYTNPYNPSHMAVVTNLVMYSVP